MKYNKIKYLIATLLLCLVAAPLSAKKKVFYDSKSNIVGITGDYNFLKSTDKFYPLNVQIPTDSYSSPKDKCEYWNKLNFGKRFWMSYSATMEIRFQKKD